MNVAILCVFSFSISLTGIAFADFGGYQEKQVQEREESQNTEVEVGLQKRVKNKNLKTLF